MHNQRDSRESNEHAWRDEVAPKEVPLGRAEADAFISDMRDMIGIVVECTVEPLLAFAESVPRALAYDSREWHRAWREQGRRAGRRVRQFSHR